MNDLAPARLGPIPTFRNGLLRALPAAELARIAALLQPVELKPRQTLHQSRLPMRHVFFIEQGLVSVSGRAASDRWIEVWLIGAEGMTGIPLVLGDDEPPLRRVVQVGGSALCIGRSDLLRAMDEAPTLRMLLLRYAEVVLLQTAQASACNATHEIRQRLSRWLLLARDGLGEDTLPLTHRVLAHLLGVRRPSVTQGLGQLERAGAIRTGRGRIEIVDGKALEASSCDCHRLIRHEYERLLGPGFQLATDRTSS